MTDITNVLLKQSKQNEKPKHLYLIFKKGKNNISHTHDDLS